MTEPENEIKTADEMPVALTSAEQEQITAEKRNRLYGSAVRAAAVFAVAGAALMAAFKLNEDFFDASSRIGLLMESVNAAEANQSYPKINVRVQFQDINESKLVIPLAVPVADEDIAVREEFTQNKLIITLEGVSETIEDGIRLTSDSQIMDAVGVYRQNLDVVVEVYCRDMYSYAIENSGEALTVSFFPLRNDCDLVAVVYVPYEDRNRFALSEWQDSLLTYASDNRIRLFMASNMQEAYTQQEVMEFAEAADADVVLGIQVSTDTQAQQTTAAAVCNTTYFVPGFNSAQLSVVYAGAFVSETQMPFTGFEEADENTPLVYMAERPAAMLKISQSQKDADSMEAVYKLNEKLVSVIQQTLGCIHVREEEAGSRS